MNQDLEPLIARLEAAEGPSRELDGDIAEALGLHKGRRIPPADRAMFAMSPAHLWIAPKFTGTIEAAMTLVPEGWHFQRIEGDIEGHFTSEVESNDRMESWYGTHRHIPNALCIAALHARQSGEG